MPRSSKPEPACTSAPPSRDEDSRRCRTHALDLLARREHTRLELKRKLLARSYAAVLVDELLEQLQREGLLDESRFIESFVRARAEKGQGPARIRAELAHRGVEEARARQWLGESGLDWDALAAAARRKRFGRARPHGFKERARQARFLEYRGFEPGQIRAALDSTGDSD